MTGGFVLRAGYERRDLVRAGPGGQRNGAGIERRQGHGAPAGTAGHEPLARLQRFASLGGQQFRCPCSKAFGSHRKNDASFAQRALNHQRIAFRRGGQRLIAMFAGAESGQSRVVSDLPWLAASFTAGGASP